MTEFISSFFESLLDWRQGEPVGIGWGREDKEIPARQGKGTPGEVQVALPMFVPEPS